MLEQKIISYVSTPEIQLAYKFLSVSIALVAIVLEYGEGHFISWLTLPALYIFSLYLNRNFTRSLVAIFSMGLLHEGLWFMEGIIPFYIITKNANYFVLNGIHWSNVIDLTILPLIFTFLYAKKYVNFKSIFYISVCFSGFMLLWDSVGFPISTLNQSGKPYHFLSYEFEVSSWILIFLMYSFLEAKSHVRAKIRTQ